MRIRALVGRALSSASLVAMGAALACANAAQAETIDIGIGTQDTTTNTVTGGIVIKKLHLLDKYLPHTGKYKDVTYNVTWQNATSGPPITNGMIAGKLQIGMMGDYPLLVNGATGQATHNDTELVAVIAYNAHGSGNGVVVPKNSPYYDLADLKGKRVSVPFGSAAHGMLLAALQSRHLPSDYFALVNQSPEVGSTSIQENRIDAHADFVPFAELLPYRGFARKIFDGAQTGQPTLHGVVIRKDFGQKYPEIVTAYIRALMEADDWVRHDPEQAAQQVQTWTKVDKQVAYIFLGPGGIDTLDPTIKPRWVAALKTDYAVLKKLDMVKDLDIDKWVDDSFVRAAFKASGRDYDAQLADFSNYQVQGNDTLCNAPIDDPSQAGQIWAQGGKVVSFSSAACTLEGVNALRAQGKKIDAVYLTDKTLGVKVFADAAFYTIGAANGKRPDIESFLLKRDAEASAKRSGESVASYAQALSAAGSGGK
ncbi:ABC transporter substrate-binding protein [Trinickia sp. Y13]|uniref:ABC transporter substrate-binding protein n=1 Tax=Trinickia sp. Y13 TaxID=2917807 RepID=UPI002407421D|nr:ABC transporter substrate-binding protein [Trinickia sp. Y13]MDG0022892.1 ABC transporter substrate-binding protein [Trinickia sp. Y13]